jgi:hypothetical protein
LDITLELAALPPGGGGGEGDVSYIQGYNIISQSISSFESNAVLSGMHTNENRNQTFTDFSASIDSRVSSGGSTVTTEFNLFTQSYYAADIISGSDQITALGFISDIGDALTGINEWTSSQEQDVRILSQSVEERLTTVEGSTSGLVGGLVSGSSQIIYNEISGVPTIIGTGSINVNSELDGEGNTTIIVSADSVGDVAWNSITSKPANIISGSNQIIEFGTFLTGSYLDLPSKITGSGIEYSTLKNAPTGFISSSQQITDFGFVSESGVAPQGTISSSQQIADFGYISSSIGFYSSSNQISESGYINRTELLWTQFSSSAESRLTDIEELGGGGVGLGSNIFVGDQTISGSVFISGALTVDEFSISNVGLGEPIIYSATNINLSASAGAVIINSSPLRLASYVAGDISGISVDNGDLIYNSTTNEFNAYQNGSWITLANNEFLENTKTNTSHSLFLGYRAAVSHSVFGQSDSVVIGGSAGTEYEFGTRNTLVGFYTNRFSKTSDDNTAVGYAAMRDNISGSQQTAIGSLALAQNQLGLRNTAIGYASSQLVKTSDNTSLGYQAGRAGSYGASNTSIGSFSNWQNVSGSFNVSIGASTMYENVSGSVNTAVGARALYNSVNTQNNTAIGYQSLYNNVSGSHNVGVGSDSLLSNTSGSDNVSIGYRAGLVNTIGEKNIFIGTNAGRENVSGSSNVIIGYNINTLSAGESNQIIIGASASGSGENTATIGNDTTTATYLKGVVNAGTTFRMPSYTDAQTGSLSPSNGDMVYNTTVNKFVGYANGAWVELH